MNEPGQGKFKGKGDEWVGLGTWKKNWEEPGRDDTANQQLGEVAYVRREEENRQWRIDVTETEMGRVEEEMLQE
jgi:hypothetical protein